MSRVLIVDDDTELCDLLAAYLTREGFQVEAANAGEAGLERALAGGWALVVLDVMLPGLSGFDVLRRLRAASAVPVIMLTARGEEVDRVVGLELGADDYLTKPFSPRELLARMRAVLRRAISGDQGFDSKLVRVGDVTIDTGSHTARCAERPIHLTGTEFALLELLVRSAGDVISREVLSRSVLGRRAAPYDRSLDVHVSSLRRKLGPYPDGSERIRSVRGAGYFYRRPPE